MLGSLGGLGRPGRTWIAAHCVVAFFMGCGDPQPGSGPEQGESQALPGVGGDGQTVEQFWTDVDASLSAMALAGRESSEPSSAAGGPVAHRIDLRGPSLSQIDALGAMLLPQHADVWEVRRFVARVLEASAHVRVISARDLAVDKLASVGAHYVRVLLEALRHVGNPLAEARLVKAIELVADDSQKALILKELSPGSRLIAVVLKMGWARDAEAVVRATLDQKSTTLDPAWAIAAVDLPGDQHLDDLKFQMARGPSPLRVWEATRTLPGMDSLDDYVARVWRELPRQEFSDRWRELAVIAAHYGHVDALREFAGFLPRKPWWLTQFKELTGYGRDGNESLTPAEWFEENAESLHFDEVRGRYVRR